MESEKKTTTTHLVSIRRQKRNRETQQIKNLLRFKNQISSLQDEEKQEEANLVISQQDLEKCFINNNFQALVDAIISGSLDIVNIIEQNIEQIGLYLFQRLTTPKIALTLDFLCKKSQLFVIYVFSSNKFEEIALRLTKLPIGSKELGVYHSIIFSLLQKERNLDPSLLNLLFPHFEQAFLQNSTLKREDNLLVRVVTAMIQHSNMQHRFSEYFTVQFINSFWVVKNEVNRINIYLACVAIAKSKTYKRSLSVLLAVVRTIKRGRTYLPIELDEQVPSKIALLVSVFRLYNQQSEYLEGKSQMQIEGMILKVSLHELLLDYESDIFQIGQITQIYLQLLFQFCRNGPNELIANKFHQLGILDRLVSEMTQSPSICFLCLKIWRAILEGDRLSRKIGCIMSDYALRQTIWQGKQLFYDKNISELGDIILDYLKTQ